MSASSFTHATTITYKAATGDTIVVPIVQVGDGEDNRILQVASGAVNAPCLLTLTLTRIMSLILVSTRDVTIKTNSTSSPGDTITLSANRPRLWFPNSNLTSPFTVDVTALYLTNASGAAAQVDLRILQDSTV